MCEASKALKDITFAKAGDDVQVQGGGSHKLFARPGDCGELLCLPYGASVMFENLPTEILERLKVANGPVEAVMLSQNDTMERSWSNRDDVFAIKGNNKKRFWLRELPVGIVCKVISVPALVSGDALAAINPPQPATSRQPQLATV